MYNQDPNQFLTSMSDTIKIFDTKMFGTKMFAKKLPLTLDLFKWNFMEYNTLSEVEIAHNNLQNQPAFTKFLDDMYTFTKEHSIELGVRLVHRQVDEGKIMIEKFQFDQNSPSLITSADILNRSSLSRELVT